MINVRCPICDRTMQSEGPSEWPAWPFCSERCRLIDLGRWLGEHYRVPDDATRRVLPDDGADNSDDTPKSAVPSAAPHRDEA